MMLAIHPFMVGYVLRFACYTISSNVIECAYTVCSVKCVITETTMVFIWLVFDQPKYVVLAVLVLIKGLFMDVCASMYNCGVGPLGRGSLHFL